MPHLDAAHDADLAAVGGPVARHHVADVGHGLRFRQVAAPVDARQVEAGLIGADHEVRHRRHVAVGDHADRLLRADRAEEPRLAAQVGEDLGLRRQAVLGHAGDLAQLDLVDGVVAAYQRQHEAAIRHHGHRLDGALERNAEQCGDVLAGLLRGRGDLGHRFRGGGAWTRCGRLCGFDVRGIVGAGGERDGVLARIRQHVELLRGIAADGAAVGLHRAEVQAQAGEDARVGRMHVAVFTHQILVGDVEGVRILHHELARTHHAETRTDLVAELGLDLVEVDRQLLVAGELLAREVGHRFFGRGAVAEVLLLAVGDLQQLAAELLPAARLFPQLARLDGRHDHFDRAGAVHFLADDGFHLAQHAQAQRRPGVQAGGQLADHAGAQHQLVADQFGVGRGFLGGAEMELRQAHRHRRSGGRIAYFASLGRVRGVIPTARPDRLPPVCRRAGHGPVVRSAAPWEGDR